MAAAAGGSIEGCHCLRGSFAVVPQESLGAGKYVRYSVKWPACVVALKADTGLGMTSWLARDWRRVRADGHQGDLH